MLVFALGYLGLGKRSALSLEGFLRTLILALTVLLWHSLALWSHADNKKELIILKPYPHRWDDEGLEYLYKLLQRHYERRPTTDVRMADPRHRIGMLDALWEREGLGSERIWNLTGMALMTDASPFFRERVARKLGEDGFLDSSVMICLAWSLIADESLQVKVAAAKSLRQLLSHSDDRLAKKEIRLVLREFKTYAEGSKEEAGFLVFLRNVFSESQDATLKVLILEQLLKRDYFHPDEAQALVELCRVFDPIVRSKALSLLAFSHIRTSQAYALLHQGLRDLQIVESTLENIASALYREGRVDSEGLTFFINGLLHQPYTLSPAEQGLVVEGVQKLFARDSERVTQILRREARTTPEAFAEWLSEIVTNAALLELQPEAKCVIQLLDMEDHHLPVIPLFQIYGRRGARHIN